MNDSVYTLLQPPQTTWGKPLASSTVENYLKRLYMLQQRTDAGERIAMGSLARAAGVTAGTATSMIKSMADAGLVDYASRDGVLLTSQGQKLALSVLRRHRIIELFLVEHMGMDWSEVHDDAEEMEHVISEKLLERMDAMLGHPAFDPHGDPIPSATGKMAGRTLVPLDELKSRTATVARITDHAPDFLRYLDALGLVPGSQIELIENNPLAEVVKIRTSQGEIALSTSAAHRLHVTIE